LTNDKCAQEKKFRQEVRRPSRARKKKKPAQQESGACGRGGRVYVKICQTSWENTLYRNTPAAGPAAAKGVLQPAEILVPGYPTIEASDHEERSDSDLGYHRPRGQGGGADRGGSSLVEERSAAGRGIPMMGQRDSDNDLAEQAFRTKRWREAVMPRKCWVLFDTIVGRKKENHPYEKKRCQRVYRRGVLSDGCTLAERLAILRVWGSLSLI